MNIVISPIVTDNKVLSVFFPPLCCKSTKYIVLLASTKTAHWEFAVPANVIDRLIVVFANRLDHLLLIMNI